MALYYLSYFSYFYILFMLSFVRKKKKEVETAKNFDVKYKPR